MAPAVIAGGIPKAEPMPNSATPTVPMVERELPMARETKEQSSSAVTRKNRGEMICRP